jgi:hypothetical protein
LTVSRNFSARPDDVPQPVSLRERAASRRRAHAPHMNRGLGALLGNLGPDLAEIEGTDPHEKILDLVRRMLARFEIENDAFAKDQQSGSRGEAEHPGNIRFAKRIDPRESHIRKALRQKMRIAWGRRRVHEFDDERGARFDVRMKIRMGELEHGCSVARDGPAVKQP